MGWIGSRHVGAPRTVPAWWVGVAVVVGCACSPSGPLHADEPWSWPERAENLQVLPEGFSGQRLRAVMTGFSRALGVRCSHCHVGEEGRPLASYDFPSDDNPNKRTARVMLEMLGDINDRLKQIEPSGAQRVNMWCHTCHRGAPRPMGLAELLGEVIDQEGPEAAVARYRELRGRHHGRGTYDFGEETLNGLGYRLLEQARHDEAIAVFRLNAEFFPRSANAHDSLAEGFLEAGRAELAEVYYRKSLELDPDNSNAVSKLREIRAGS